MSIYKEDTKTMKKIKEEVLKIIRKYTTPESQVLVLGCHNDSIVAQIDFEDIFLVDIKFGECKYKNHSNIHHFEMDLNQFITYALALGFKADVIIMTSVIEHLTGSERVNCLERIKELLNPNGIFVLGYPNCRSINRILGVEMGLLPYPSHISFSDKEVGHKCMFGVNAIRDFKTLLELKSVTIKGIMFKPLPNSMMDDYFGDRLDVFIKIGYDLGFDVCSYIVVVFKNE